MEKVAVVILNWNGSEMMKTFLPSVVRYSTLQNAEVRVYVADNGSTDGSVEMLRQQFPTVSLICFEQNYGFADGYNKALQELEAPYVVLLNSDVEVTPHWLEPLVAYMDVHPEVAACQPKLMDWKHKERFEYAGACGGFLDCYGYPFCRGRVFDTVEEDKGQYDVPVPLLWATGACLFVRLSDYLQAGGLDGRFFAHMEEVDFCWRLRTRNRGIACVSASVVYHVGGATLDKSNPRKTFLNFRNNRLMLYKNLPESEVRWVLFVRLLLDYVAAFQFLLKGEKENFKAVFQALHAYRLLKPEFAASRQENRQKAILKQVPERCPLFLLWKYYGRGKKVFSELMK